MFNKTKNTDDKASKRVCGQFLLSFDLDKIFKNISMLRQIKDQQKRSQIIAKNTSNTKMYKKSERTTEHEDVDPFGFKEQKIKESNKGVVSKSGKDQFTKSAFEL